MLLEAPCEYIIMQKVATYNVGTMVDIECSHEALEYITEKGIIKSSDVLGTMFAKDYNEAIMLTDMHNAGYKFIGLFQHKHYFVSR